jgi:hypothetical protein
MQTQLGSRWALAVSCLVLAAGGGCNAHSAVPAPSSLGLACGDVQTVVAGEVDVSNTPPECGREAVCLHGNDVAAGASESPGMCTCRCDGPAGAGPFCSCSDGFICRDEVGDLGVSDPALAGSYCVPAG